MSLCLSNFDLFTFCVSMAGILMSVVYFLWKLSICPRPPDDDCDVDLRANLLDWLKTNNSFEEKEKLEIAFEDYETCCHEIGRRDNIVLLVGTILVGASLIIFGNAATKEIAYPLGNYALGSIGLYAVWLWVMHETAVKLNNIAYDRIKAIEQALTKWMCDGEKTKNPFFRFGVHTYYCSETEGQRVWWLRLRRLFWGILLLFLSIVWLLLPFM